DELAECDEVVVRALGRLLPGKCAAALLDVCPTLVGQLVDAFAVRLRRAHELLVGELLQRRVDAAGARCPRALAALADLADDLVAVHRLLGEQRKDRGADVAAAGLVAAAEMARLEATPRTEARAAAPSPAASAADVEDVEAGWAGLHRECVHD